MHDSKAVAAVGARQLVMEPGISQVPAGLQGIEALNTPAKLETALKTEITRVTPGIPQTGRWTPRSLPD